MLEPDLKTRFSKIKLLALDVDGTLTDGGLYYSENGEELKKFNVKDGQGIKRLMQAGIEVAIISANAASATLHRAKKLGITHVAIGVEDKLVALQPLCEKLGLSLDEVAYAGDDVNDLSVMQVVGCPFAIADGIEATKDCALYVTKLAGGKGAVREICELILASKDKDSTAV
ncbi:MAG: HAD-IIIA family hydrolase [Phormidesmis sp.]